MHSVWLLTFAERENKFIMFIIMRHRAALRCSCALVARNRCAEAVTSISVHWFPSNAQPPNTPRPLTRKLMNGMCDSSEKKQEKIAVKGEKMRNLCFFPPNKTSRVGAWKALRERTSHELNISLVETKKVTMRHPLILWGNVFSSTA